MEANGKIIHLKDLCLLYILLWRNLYLPNFAKFFSATFIFVMIKLKKQSPFLEACQLLYDILY